MGPIPWLVEERAETLSDLSRDVSEGPRCFLSGEILVDEVTLRA